MPPWQTLLWNGRCPIKLPCGAWLDCRSAWIPLLQLLLAPQNAVSLVLAAVSLQQEVMGRAPPLHGWYGCARAAAPAAALSPVLMAPEPTSHPSRRKRCLNAAPAGPKDIRCERILMIGE
jgi:hypothetical protein